MTVHWCDLTHTGLVAVSEQWVNDQFQSSTTSLTLPLLTLLLTVCISLGGAWESIFDKEVDEFKTTLPKFGYYGIVDVEQGARQYHTKFFFLYM